MHSGTLGGEAKGPPPTGVAIRNLFLIAYEARYWVLLKEKMALLICKTGAPHGKWFDAPLQGWMLLLLLFTSLSHVDHPFDSSRFPLPALTPSEMLCMYY